MTQILETALARLAAAQSEVERWDRFIREYHELAGSAPVAVVRQSRAAALLERLPDSNGALRETETKVLELIRRNGNRPIPTRSLFDTLKESGFEVGGKDGVATLSARLSRSKMLENHKPFGWRIKTASQEIGSEAPATTLEASETDPETHSSPVEPAAGGGI